MPKKMRFGIIDPRTKTAKVAEFASFDDALEAAGLKPGQIDFGALSRALSIVVYEYGLFEPMEQTDYFSIKRKLYAGNALIYATNEAGETISLPPSKKFPVEVKFYDDGKAALQAIEMEEIDQPSISIGDTVEWVWPQPAPASRMEPKEKNDD